MALMNCPECGRTISENAPACIGCGNPMTKQKTKVETSNTAQCKTLGMKWAWFWTYIALPLQALSLFGGGLAFIVFGSDIPYSYLVGSLLAIWGLSQVFATVGLHKKRAWGWKTNLILLGISTLFYLMSSYGKVLQRDRELHGNEIADDNRWKISEEKFYILLGAPIWLLPNYFYWKKRKNLYS